MALLRYPRFRFRPAQSDLLHLDLWLHGENLLRDAGTYSYNPPADDGPDWNRYFPGVAAHNTVQFDDRDQMPRLGRFLFGAWPSAKAVAGPDDIGSGGVAMAAGYHDWQGAEHHRQVRVAPNRLTVVDRVAGFRARAVLRWRLPPGEWRWRDDHTLVCGPRTLTVSATVPIRERRLVEGWESRYYSRKSPLPVLEIEIGEAGTLTTEWAFPE
ncbi:MAG: heparinase II/III-family protein [Alcanivorax sp.]|nr:heparinase II/III-family protein [Alcanivorax sp.]